nr:MAG TPA: hypothetical protein [Caudoviricetes sp.]DAU51348.1 MAG TPA: hypothetical protein [Caudoviricetes sp.]
MADAEPVAAAENCIASAVRNFRTVQPRADTDTNAAGLWLRRCIF